MALAAATAVMVPTSICAVRWDKVFKVLAMFWTLCYPGVSVKMLRVFKCREVEGQWWLETDLRLACFDSVWWAHAVVAFVVLGLFTIGLPLGIGLWLRANRNSLTTTATKERLGFL